MDFTTRRFPRTLREAFPAMDKADAIGINGPVVIKTKRPIIVRAICRCDEWLAMWGWSPVRHDLAAAFRAAVNEWRRCRWLRAGGNPDVCPF